MQLKYLMTGTAIGLLAGWSALPGLAQEPQVLRVQIEADVRSTDPGVNRDASTDNVMLHIVEGLVAYREDTSVGPLLAETVDISDDGKSYTFTLRDGVTFHNGAPLTAAEVVWTWERYLDPATEWRCRPDLDGTNGFKIESISAPDANTIVFTVNQPNALFLTTMARTDCGMSGILHPDSLNADGTWNSPIGTGPFKLGDWRRGQSITLDKFADYAALAGERDGYTGGKAPLVDAVQFIIVPDAASAKAALLAGDIDLIPDIDNAAKTEIEAIDGFTVSVAGSTGKSGILFQTNDPVLADVRVREAIAHALDVDQMVDAITSGLAEANGSMVSDATGYYSAIQAERPTYDPELAKSLLADAGYDGEEIVLLANQSYSSMFDTAIYAQGMLQAVGLNVRLEVLEWGNQLDRYNSGAYQMMAFAYSARLDPALSFDQMMGPKADQPRKVWDNPAAQALLEESMQVTDPARRQAIFDEMHQLYLADMPMIMLYNGAALAAASDRVEGYQAWAANTPRLFAVSLGD